MIRSFLSVGSLTMLSRALGLIREILLARYLGAGAVADAFIIAFKLPNFFRRLFAEGAFSAAFVPLFSKRLGAGEQAEAERFANDSLAILLTGLLAFTLVAELFMPWIILGLTGVDDTGTRDLTVRLTRFTFPYLMLISLVALLSGILHAHNRYAAAAGAPIVLNMALIVSLLLINDAPERTANALALSVSIGGGLQLALLLWGVRRQGWPLRLYWPRLTPGLRQLLRRMGPAALGAGAVQVNLLVDIILASRLLDTGALSFLYYADRLNQLPLGVIGIAVATVLLPSISRSLGAGDGPGARSALTKGLDFALLITVPAAVALMAVPEVILRPLYQHGAFTAADTMATATALRAYALGLPAYILVKILTAAFFASEDTATPMRLSLAALVLNLVLNLILIGPLGHGGLALATALAAWGNAMGLGVILWRRGFWAPDMGAVLRIARMGLASAIMVIALIVLTTHLPPDPGKAGQIIAMLLALLVGLGSYGLGAWVLRLVRMRDLVALYRRA